MAKITPLKVGAGLVFAPQIIQSLLSMYPPFSSGIARKAYGEDPNLVPTPSELVGQVQKGIITDEKFVNLMMQGGIAPAHAENMLKNARSFLAGLDYITAWRRGDIKEAELDHVLSQQGLTEADIKTLKSVTTYFPTPQDLIRFAVRDVYTSQTIEQYGLFEDYPDLLNHEAAKAGLPPDIAKLYWGAHWELPSPTQVYDMFHRNIVTYEQMATYLKVADYMPFWRDKLIELSYDPITRVDIRRMYAMGVLSESEVTRRYQDLGYSPGDAILLTRFTVLEVTHSDETTSHTLVISSYKAGSIDRQTAFQRLIDSKTSSEVANVLLDNADSAIRQELIDLEADSLTDQFRAGHINMDQYQTELTRIGVPARMLQLTIQRELAQSRKRAKSSTKGDLDTWWKEGVVGNEGYKSRMLALGYENKDISKFLAELHFWEYSQDKVKFPWAPSMRDYHDGLITDQGLFDILNGMYEGGPFVQTLMELARSVKD